MWGFPAEIIMNWLNKLKYKTALQWEYNKDKQQQSPDIQQERSIIQQEQPSPTLQRTSTNRKVLEDIENAIIANQANIEKIFKKKYPQGIQETDIPKILLDLQEDVLSIVAKILDKHPEIPFHPMSQALLSNKIYGIAIGTLGLKEKLTGWKEIDI